MLEKMLAGQPMVQIGLGQPASPAERKEIAETRASIDALDNLKMLFDSAQTKTGPLVGRYSPVAGLIGMTTDEQEAFMAATSAFKNAIIKEITGAQMSEVEANRIMKQVPDITDPATRWRAKWEQSRKNLEMLQKRRAEILEQSGLRVPGENIPQTIEQPTTEIPPDISQMSNEELIKLAGLSTVTPPTIGKLAPKAPVSGQTTAKRAEITKPAPTKPSKTISPKEKEIADKIPRPKTKTLFKIKLRHISNRNVAKRYYERWKGIVSITESFDDLWKPLSGKR